MITARSSESVSLLSSFASCQRHFAPVHNAPSCQHLSRNSKKLHELQQTNHSPFPPSLTAISDHSSPLISKPPSIVHFNLISNSFRLLLPAASSTFVSIFFACRSTFVSTENVLFLSYPNHRPHQFRLDFPFTSSANRIRSVRSTFVSIFFGGKRFFRSSSDSFAMAPKNSSVRVPLPIRQTVFPLHRFPFTSQ